MNTNLDINVEIERLNKLCASKSIDNNTLLADMKKIKKNKDVTTIYKYGFNSLQDAVALAKVILRKKKLLKVESMLFNSDESSDVTSLEVDSYQQKYIENASKKSKNRIKIGSGFKLGFTWLFTGVTFMAVLAIIIFVFHKGWSTLSWNFFSGDYKSQQVSAMTKDGYYNDGITQYSYDPKSNEFYSSRWGIAVKDSKSNDGQATVEITYLDSNSPLVTEMVDMNENIAPFAVGWNLAGFTIFTDDFQIISVGVKAEKPKDETYAQYYMEVMDKTTMIILSNITYGGDGIRGSFVATIYMILLTLLFALPLGIGGAIYLAVYSKPNKFTSMVRSAIDLLSGIPSIIFGLIGAMVFIPITSGGGHQGSLLSGALTLAIMVLPIIIKNTEEAIKVIPKSLSEASLSLGASQSQTVFKVILPNAMSGILTGTILATGRIIGESASLMFAVGITIQDNIQILSPATTLATHIWYIMAGENPNYDAACSISIVILFMVLILNVLLSIVSHYLNRYQANASETWFTKIIHKIKKKRQSKKEAI